MARIIPLDELTATWGHGWEESRFEDDDTGKITTDLQECAWLYGNTIHIDGSGYCDQDNSDWVKANYRKWLRVWDKKPTAKERKAAKWDG